MAHLSACHARKVSSRLHGARARTRRLEPANQEAYNIGIGNMKTLYLTRIEQNRIE